MSQDRSLSVYECMVRVSPTFSTRVRVNAANATEARQMAEAIYKGCEVISASRVN